MEFTKSTPLVPEAFVKKLQSGAVLVDGKGRPFVNEKGERVRVLDGTPGVRKACGSFCTVVEYCEVCGATATDYDGKRVYCRPCFEKKNV